MVKIANQLLFRLFGVKAGAGAVLSPTALRTAGRGVSIGSGSIVLCYFSQDRAGAQIVIGDCVYIGRSHIVSAERVEIGDDAIISWGVTIVDHDSHSLEWSERRNDVTDWRTGRKDWQFVTRRPVVIAPRCWIGFNASILKGVTVGEGAVVGACSVVTRDVPPYTVVAGNPARVVRALSSDRGSAEDHPMRGSRSASKAPADDDAFWGARPIVGE